MYVYYNAHPKGLIVDDCVKRAITVTTRKKYMQVQKELGDYKKVTGAKRFYSDGNPSRYVEEVLGAKKMNFTSLAGLRRMTAEKFARSHPEGRYILSMSGHWSACVNGNIIDTWDCSEEFVNSAYAITPVSDAPMDKPILRLCYTVQSVGDDDKNVTFYDGNGMFVSKTLPGDDAEVYIASLRKKGYPDLTNLEEWL